MRRKSIPVLVGFALIAMSAAMAAADPGPTGQVSFGQVSIEPAYDDVTGQLIYLLTPDKVAQPSKANPIATVSPLNCLPTNCDHVQVLPPGLVASLGLQSVYPTGTISTKYGSLTGGLVKGHDHLVGVAKTGGDFNVAWHVYLVLFTTKGAGDGAINQPLRTLSDVNAAIARGDAVGPLDSGIVFNCSITSEATYLRGH